jgi:ketosteroid isomerase-like protein
MDEASTKTPATLDNKAMSENKEIARRFLLAIPAQDATAMRSVLAPEAHLTLMIAGVYSPQLRAFPQGTQWDRDGMIEMEMNFQRKLDGPFALEVLSLIAEGDSVAAAALGKGRRAATGQPYIQHYSYHFQMTNGRIVDIRLYQDTFHLWQVWSDLGAGVQPHYLKAGILAGGAQEQTLDPLPDMTAEDEIAANKKAVRRFLTSVRNRNPQETRVTWSPEGLWSFAIGGDYSPELRTFHGAPRWDREGMIKMQQNAHGNPREPMTLDIYSLLAEGDEISAEAVGIIVRANGRAYRQHYSFHFKAHNGRLVEGHVYQDTLHQYDVTLDPPDGGPVAVRMSSVGP